MVGARRVGPARSSRAGGQVGVSSGSAPSPARRHSPRGHQQPPHPDPALVYAPEPGRQARLRGPASSAHGLPRRRRTAEVRPFTSGLAPGSGRTRARVGTRGGAMGWPCGRVTGRACAL